MRLSTCGFAAFPAIMQDDGFKTTGRWGYGGATCIFSCVLQRRTGLRRFCVDWVITIDRMIPRKQTWKSGVMCFDGAKLFQGRCGGKRRNRYHVDAGKTLSETFCFVFEIVEGEACLMSGIR